jgi:hypothetical protein
MEFLNNEIVKINDIYYKNLTNNDWTFTNKNDSDFLNNLNLNKS